MDEDDLLLDEDEEKLLFRAAEKLKKRGDDTVRAMALDIEDDDQREEMLARAALVDALIPGGDGDA